MKFSEFFRKHLTPKRLALAEWTLSILLLGVLVTNFIGCGGGNGSGGQGSQSQTGSAQQDLSELCPVPSTQESIGDKEEHEIIAIATSRLPDVIVGKEIHVINHRVVVIFRPDAQSASKKADHEALLARGWSVSYARNDDCIVLYKTPKNEDVVDAVNYARTLKSIKKAKFDSILAEPGTISYPSSVGSKIGRSSNAEISAGDINGLPDFSSLAASTPSIRRLVGSASSNNINACVLDSFEWPNPVVGYKEYGPIEFISSPPVACNNGTMHGYRVCAVMNGVPSTAVAVLPECGIYAVNKDAFLEYDITGKEGKRRSIELGATLAEAAKTKGVRVVNVSWGWPRPELVETLRDGNFVINEKNVVPENLRPDYQNLLWDIRQFLSDVIENSGNHDLLFVQAEPNDMYSSDDTAVKPGAKDEEQVIRKQVIIVSSLKAPDGSRYLTHGKTTDVYGYLTNQALEGNSFIAPIVSSVALAIFNVNPCLKSDEVKSIITSTCDSEGCINAGAALRVAIASTSDHLSWPTSATITVEYLNTEKSVAKAKWPSTQPSPAKYDFYLGDLANGVSYTASNLSTCEQVFPVNPKTAYLIRIKAKWAAGTNGPKDSTLLQMVWKQPGSDDPPAITATIPASGFVGQALFFAGTATDDIGVSAIRMEVNGRPTGEQSFSGKSIDLSRFYFGGPSAAYASSPGTYTVKLVVRDVGGQETGKDFSVVLTTPTNPGKITSVSVTPQPYLLGSGPLIFSAVSSPGAASAGLQLRGSNGTFLPEEPLLQTTTGWSCQRTISLPGSNRDFIISTYSADKTLLDSKSNTYTVGMPAPSALAATQDPASDKIQIFWDASPTTAEVTYKVYVAESSSGTKNELTGITVGTDSAGKKSVFVGTSQGLAIGTTYWFWATATCNGVTSDFSTPDPGSFGAVPTNNAPIWSNVSIPGQVISPARLTFSGSVSDASPGIKSIGMKVKKPDGTTIDAFSPDQFSSPYPTTKDLSVYSFRTADAGYATVPGIYETWLTAEDAAGLSSESSHFSISVSAAPADTPPVFSADAGLPTTVALGQKVAFIGSISDDTGLASIRMTVDGVDIFGNKTLSGNTAQLSQFYFGGTGTTYATVGNHSVILAVKDTSSQETSKSFSITVQAPTDTPPVFSADAGLAAAITTGERRFFTGTVSDDHGISKITMTVNGGRKL